MINYFNQDMTLSMDNNIIIIQGLNGKGRRNCKD